ncbi:MAG: rod shape-determining protein MreD [Candidatus Omnitrophica bacterium]|nr:rod shape-determining protein MreD [Candidatus Omnitrophota bacterium]
MRKAIVITFFVVMAFIAEFLLFNTAGRWATPNLSILLVVFFNLYFGIRYGLFTAVVAGVLHESFSPDVFGIYVCSFVFCSYMTTVLKQYVYHMGSRLSRYILILIVVTMNVAAHYVLYSARVGGIEPGNVVKFVFFPEVITTMFAAPFLFTELKKCVSRLFV